MKRLIVATVLTSVLSVSALAGDIPTGGIAAPPPNGTTQSTSTTSPGDIPSDGIALSFIQIVIDLLT